jgi:hypothetical protein
LTVLTDDFAITNEQIRLSKTVATQSQIFLICDVLFACLALNLLWALLTIFHRLIAAEMKAFIFLQNNPALRASLSHIIFWFGNYIAFWCQAAWDITFLIPGYLRILDHPIHHHQRQYTRIRLSLVQFRFIYEVKLSYDASVPHIQDAASCTIASLFSICAWLACINSDIYS